MQRSDDGIGRYRCLPQGSFHIAAYMPRGLHLGKAEPFQFVHETLHLSQHAVIISRRSDRATHRQAGRADSAAVPREGPKAVLKMARLQ